MCFYFHHLLLSFSISKKKYIKCHHRNASSFNLFDLFPPIFMLWNKWLWTASQLQLSYKKFIIANMFETTVILLVFFYFWKCQLRNDEEKVNRTKSPKGEREKNIVAHCLLFKLQWPNRYTTHMYESVFVVIYKIALVNELSSIIACSTVCLNQRQKKKRQPHRKDNSIEFIIMLPPSFTQ